MGSIPWSDSGAILNSSIVRRRWNHSLQDESEQEKRKEEEADVKKAVERYEGDQVDEHHAGEKS